jgi:hypothetical protein
MHVPKVAIAICVLAIALGVGGWQSARYPRWEYAVVEIGSVSTQRTNIFFLDQDGYHEMDLGVGQGSGSKHDSVSTNTDIRVRMAGKALAKLGSDGWELVGTGPSVADTPYFTYYLKRSK